MSATASTMAPGRGGIDLGRVVMLPLMATFGLVNLGVLWQHISEPASSAAVQVALVARSLLLVAFYSLVVTFYALRTRARSTTSSWPARASAVVATLLPLVLAAAVAPVDHLAVLWASNVVMCAGLAWSVWSLLHLGRSLSIVPQARALVRDGPYRIVRHPLYLGELATALGVVLGGFSWPAIAILTALVALQLHRTGQEEAILAGAFPEYLDYRDQTPARVLPRLF